MDLKTWRISNGITQKQLAEMLGVTDVSVCRYETGVRRNIPENIMQKIICVTSHQVTPNDFFGIIPTDEISSEI